MEHHFGTIRSLFEGPISRTAFLSVVRAILLWHRESPHDVDRFMPYVQEKLERWFAQTQLSWSKMDYEVIVDPMFRLDVSEGWRLLSGLTVRDFLVVMPLMRSIQCAYQYDWSEVLVEWLTSPGCVRLEHLTMNAQRIEPYLPVLCQSENLQAVHVLSLANHNFSVEDLQMLARSPLLCGVRYLDLSYVNVCSSGARALFEHGALDQLVALNLAFGGINDDVLDVLLGLPQVQRLQSLELSGSRWSPNALTRLCEAPMSLTHLSLTHLISLGHALTQICDAPWGDALTSLELTYGEGGDEILLNIAHGNAFRQVVNLRLPNLQISALTTCELFTSAVMWRLESLCLWGASFDETVWPMLARVSAPLLHTLDLGMAEMTDDGAFALAKADLPNLKTLILDNSAISCRGIEALSQASWFGQLECLTIAETDVADDGLLALCHHATSLFHLDISMNRIGRAGMLALAQAPWTAQLREFSCSGISWSSDVQEMLMASPYLSVEARHQIWAAYDDVLFGV